LLTQASRKIEKEPACGKLINPTTKKYFHLSLEK
jgi:hypothetical protein